jgi:hypothetical protein
MSGYIYCFSNDKIGDVYKIGFTTRDPIIRLNEANSSGTWNISQVTYKFEFAKKVDDCCLVEKKIHDILESFNTRVYPNREFFKLSLTIIKKLFDIIHGDWYIPEKCNELNNIITSIDENAITCEKCSKIYSSNSSYNRHINLGRCKIKTNEMVCGYCYKSFRSKQNRQKHEIKCKDTHNNEIKKLNDKITKLEKCQIATV